MTKEILSKANTLSENIRQAECELMVLESVLNSGNGFTIKERFGNNNINIADSPLSRNILKVFMHAWKEEIDNLEKQFNEL